jgi:aspartate oxidase
MDLDADFLVIGSGLAGLTYALTMASHGTVILLTKKTRTDANSSWAQGGIAGVLADDDSFELHKQDTLVAGAGLCHPDAVEVLVREGPERIRELIALGAHFNTEIDESGAVVLSLGREGGHSRNRIVHTADYTGWECERTLVEAVRKPATVARSRRNRHCSPREDAVRSTSTPPIRRSPLVTAWRWPGEPAPPSPTWSLYSSTRPRSTIRRRAHS